MLSLFPVVKNPLRKHSWTPNFFLVSAQDQGMPKGRRDNMKILNVQI